MNINKDTKQISAKMSKTSIFTILLLVAALLPACASVKTPDASDPWESFNRSMYNFNEVLDENIMRPVAEAYQEYIPQFIQSGVSHFLDNIDDVFVLVNDLLQFKFEQAVHEFTRILFNTTLGLFGLFDVASDFLGMEKHNEDFGQTLATWGVGNGPYLVLPFFGPSSVRDFAGLVVDSTYDPIYAISDDSVRWTAIVLRAVNTRSELLKTTDAIEKSGADPYAFTRSAYQQSRDNLIYDGNPPSKIEYVKPTKDDEALEDLLEKELGL